MTSCARWFVALAALVLAGCGQAKAQGAALTRAPDGRPLVLTFSDEFDALRLYRDGQPGSGLWRTHFGADASNGPGSRTLSGNQELELYVDQTLGANPFRVQGGVLDILGDRTKAPLPGAYAPFGYTSGLITSQPSFAQTYGYFEARVKLPKGKGLWPAIWLLPADLSWPPEIDIMESIGDPGDAYETVHSKIASTDAFKIHPSPGEFHTFAVSWDAKQIVFYLDGVETTRSPTPADMNKPMYILANLAIGGGWPGAPDASTPFPAAFSIDFIRAYRFGP